MAKMRAYFKLDLYLNEHPKVIDLSHSAIVLYVFGNAYCNRRETDGFVARPVLRRLIDVDDYGDGPTRHQLADELVKAGLWHEAGEPCPQGHDDTCPPLAGDGWRVHDFLDHNDSSEERDNRREQDAARKRASRATAKNRPDGPEPPSDGPSGGVRSDGGTRPDGQERTSGRVHDIAVTQQSTEVPPSAGRAPHATATPATVTPIPTAQTFVAAYVDAYRGRAGHDPPSRVKGQLARELGRLFADGIPAEAIKAGFVDWFEADQHPSALASFVETNGRGGQPRSRASPQARARAEDAKLARWAERMEGGNPDAAERVARDHHPPGRQLPRPGAPG